jgi:glycogen operon protein
VIRERKKFHRLKLYPGKPCPLGAHFDGEGVNFAVYAGRADKIELCLFDSQTRLEFARLPLPEEEGGIWHGYLPGGMEGMLYGFRAHGEFNPGKGLWYNPTKLLLDPYTKAVTGSFSWHEAVFCYRQDHPGMPDLRDSAPFLPKSKVLLPPILEKDHRPRIPWADMIIYETHVKGFTMRHPELAPEKRGKYLGLAEPAVIAYLKKLGVTTLELLPVFEFIDEKPLVDRGLKNYWGYNPFLFFVPSARYAISDAVLEFQQMVKALHAAGIEVMIDVVFNHTAEGNHLGPMFSLKGLDNPAYYRLVPENPQHYFDVTGCGNTVCIANAPALRLVLDALRYWVEVFQVDGFRFDLGTALGREHPLFDPDGSFFDAIRQDPVLSEIKLIAEPWDLGADGYRIGAFPYPFSEWNGKFRDCTRSFWRGDEGYLGEFGFRLSGSQDLYNHNHRRPWAGINFITSHDGFTLWDLVSYNHKHNEANAENNRDGENHNRSFNFGVEGETEDSKVLLQRKKQVRNFFATLLLAQGVPMLLAGDEKARTQKGNNNAYCQDNELTWMDWESSKDPELLAFVQQLIALRHRHPVFRRRHFFLGQPVGKRGIKDIIWFTPQGREMTPADWQVPYAKSIAVYLNGETIHDLDAHGLLESDASFLLFINAFAGNLDFSLPRIQPKDRWRPLLSTDPALNMGRTYPSGFRHSVEGQSLIVWQEVSRRFS